MDEDKYDVGKYDYLKAYDVPEVPFPSGWIMVRVEGSYITPRPSETQDEQKIDLMDACVKMMLEKFPDILFSYGISEENGVSGECSFLLKKSTALFDRLSSSLASGFSGNFQLSYMNKLKESCPGKTPNVMFLVTAVECLETTTSVQECFTFRQSVFKRGYCIFKHKAEDRVITENCEVMDAKFWEDHAFILKDE